MHTWACLSAWIADVNKGFNCVVIFFSECCVVCFRQRDLLNGTRRQKSSLFERRAEEESVVPSACLPPAGGLVRGVPKNTFFGENIQATRSCSASSDRCTLSLG